MSRFLLMFTLIVAGEINFGLPFHIARFFRPTYLDVFGFTNTQLGDLFAAYGVAAMLAYFPGGALADRYSARTLLMVSLFSTAAGGLVMATFPGALQMAMLYAYWGVTTILLFWGALIRATREWGGQSSQGRAFGLLDAGRGLVAAILAAFAVGVFAWYLPEAAELASNADKRAGLRMVVVIYTVATVAAGILCWLTIPEPTQAPARRGNPLAGMSRVMRRPVVWAQAAIIVCAYSAYKGLDNYSLYAVQVLGMDELQSARLSTYGAYVRPVAAIMAGVLADRFDAARSIGVFFAVLLIFYLILSWSVPQSSGMSIIFINLFVTYFAVFALRGIYFALLEEYRTPQFLTGAAVGMVSLVGFTPEVFFASIGGRILDANPGLEGHQNYFLFLAVIAFLGIIVVCWLLWLRRSGQENLWPETVPSSTI